MLAYSGGLDTSVILRWLIETCGAEVICYVGDVGQEEDLEETVRKALATGAVDCLVRDLREEFVRDYCFTAVQANAMYQGSYLLGTSLARPVLAKEQVRVAREVGADALAHGCTGKGNDQMRFELAFQALAPDLEIISPWREWDMRGRTELMAYAKKFDIPVHATLEKPYSLDRNLWHISYEGGVLEDPWRAPDAHMFEWTTAPEAAPDEPSIVDVDFSRGIPTAVNGEPLGPVELLVRTNELAAAHGVGRVDLVEDRAVGMKSRGVYETPGGPLLLAAGFWFSPEMDALRAWIRATQERVTGTARLKLFKGSVSVLGRRAPDSLYREDMATFEADTSYDQSDATGFIRLNALRLKLRRRND